MRMGVRRWILAVYFCFACLAQVQLRADNNEVLEQIRSNSVYICSQGLTKVKEKQITEAVPVMYERITSPATPTQIKLRFIETLTSLSTPTAYSAAVDASQQLYRTTYYQSLDIPADLNNEAGLSSMLDKLKNAICARPMPYLVFRLGHFSALLSASPFFVFLKDDSPSLLKAASVLAIEESNIPVVQVADILLHLTENSNPVLRALAYRCICKKFDTSELASFVHKALSDKNILVREALLGELAEKGAPGLEKALSEYYQQEKDERLLELVRKTRSTTWNNWFFGLVWFMVKTVFALLILAAVLAFPFLVKLWRRRNFDRALDLMKKADYAKAAETFDAIFRNSNEFRHRALLHLIRAKVRQNQTEGISVLFDQLDTRGLELADIYALAIDLDGKGLKARAVGLYLQIMERDKDYQDVARRFDCIDTKFGGGGKKQEKRQEITGAVSLVSILKQMIGVEYENFELVGKGGMGAVYSAIHKSSGERVAIKVLSPALADKETIKTRFYRESVAIANLAHPNICKIRDIKKAELPFIVMEFLDGKSLQDIINNAKEPMGREEFFSIAIPVAAALAYAHGKGIVHRDIKPENIIVTREGVPKLVDFGLVKFKETASEITGTGAMMGTPMYMSPEQLKGEQNIDARSDVYSFGLTMYRMLTLGYPFPKKAVFQRVFMEPKPLRELNPKVPAQLERIIHNCIENDADERLGDAEELVDFLEAAKDLWSE